MARLILPTDWTSQPQQTVDLAPPYKQHAELVFNANSLLLRNQGKTRHGKILTRNATYAAIKPNVFGRGVYTTDGANPAFQATDWPLPILAGSGGFSCVFALQPISGASAHSQHLVLNTTGGYNACFYLIINGYMGNGDSAFTNEPGTIWCGTYYGDSIQNGRGVKKVGAVNGSPITGVYNRFKDGKHELWLGGALADSYASAYVMPFATGTHTVRVNSAFGTVSLVADLDRCLCPAEASEVSANPWAIFAPRRGVLINVASSGTDHSLTASGIVTGSPALGSPALSTGATNHSLAATGIATGVPTLGSPAMALAPILAASRCHVQNLQTGEVYYTKGLTTGEIKPASMVKLMTALLLVEAKPTKTELLAQSVTMLSEAISEGTSATFQTGDVTNLYDLLAMAQLPSDNAAAAMIGYVIGKEALGGTPTYAQAKTKFVQLMNARAAALGMTQTTYINAHGLDNNASSPRDTNIVLAALAKNKILRDIWRFSSWEFSVTRSGAATALHSPAAYGNGYPGMVGGKGGSLTGLFNRAILWEAPNGHLIALTTMGSPTYNDLSADSAAIIANLPIDYPALATPATEFAPAQIFDTYDFGGAYWDASDSSTMWQDVAGTIPVTAAGQPVGKWAPKAGDASLYFRQTTSTKRPTFDGSKLVFDGTDDYLDLGVESFGNTGLFADSSERFMVLQKFTSSGATGTLIAKAGATQANRTFHSYVDSTVGAEPGLWMRGAQTYADNNLADGSAHTMSVWWDGERGGMGRTDQGAKHVVLGTASEEAQNILLGARTASSPAALLNGSVQHIILVDTYDHDLYRRLRDWANGATVNAFPYFAGMVDEELAASGIAAAAPILDPPVLAVFGETPLTAEDIATGSPVLGTPAPTQNHVATATGILCGAPTLGAAAFTQSHGLTASAIVAGHPILVWPVLTDIPTGVIEVDGVVTGAPSLGTPALVQNHEVGAFPVVAGPPLLGSPVLTDIPAGMIGIDGVVTGAPVLGAPALIQEHALGAGAIACGAPVFGPLNLKQQHALMASSVSTGIPAIGAPLLTETPPGGGILPPGPERYRVAAIPRFYWVKK